MTVLHYSLYRVVAKVNCKNRFSKRLADNIGLYTTSHFGAIAQDVVFVIDLKVVHRCSVQWLF